MTTMRCGDLSLLLADTELAYYWVGFIAADGYITARRLRLVLANKDKAHLMKFAKFVKFNGKKIVRRKARSTGIAIAHVAAVAELCKKFGFKRQKTYNPPDGLPKVNQKLLLAYIAGFIDGDGSIAKVHGRADCFLRIKCHRSWRKFLTDVAEVIYYVGKRSAKPARIMNCGYAQFQITDNTVIKRLKIALQKLGIPLLKRKWDKIDVHRVNRCEQAVINADNVRKLLRKGLRRIDIARKLGLCKSTVTLIIQRNKIA